VTDAPQEADRARSGAWLPFAGDLGLALVPAALTAYIGLRNGGFFPGTAALAAAEVALVIALVLGVARRPWGGISVPLIVAVAALGGLAAWTLASSDWSGSTARATIEYSRVLLYVLVLVLFGLLSFSVRRIRWMLYGLATVAVALCAVALVARTMPEVIYFEGLGEEERLGYPLNYWNALGMLAGVGIIFCGHLACSIRDSRIARVLGAAAIPLLTATLYYTFSRGASWATAGAVVVYVVVARPRALVSGAVATVPPVFALLLTLNPANAVTDRRWLPEAFSAGHEAATAIVIAVAATAAIRTIMLPYDGWAANVRLPERARRPVLAGATIALLAVVLAGAAAFDVPEVVSAKYAEFNSEDDNLTGGGGSRLLSARNNGRQEHWDVSMAAYRRDPGHGSGAGMYSVDWARDRSNNVSVLDGHSFYVELLGELGWPGLVLAAVALLTLLGGFAFRARGPDRALFAALLAAGLAWAAQASVDWIWEMPAVTLWLFAFGGAVLARRSRTDESPPSWTIGLRVVGVALCVAIMMLPMRVSVSQARIDSGLDAMDDGDCRVARAEARKALDVMSERAMPYQMIAYCDMGQNQDRHAVRSLRQAIDRDPYSWELHLSHAVARARAGQNPQRAIQSALKLNPRDQLINRVADRLSGRTPRAWRRGGGLANITPPAPPGP